MWPVIAIIASILALFFFRRDRRNHQKFSTEKGRLVADQERLTASRADFEEHSRLQEAALFNSMIEGVLVLDDADKVTLANPALHRT